MAPVTPFVLFISSFVILFSIYIRVSCLSVIAECLFNHLHCTIQSVKQVAVLKLVQERSPVSLTIWGARHRGWLTEESPGFFYFWTESGEFRSILGDILCDLHALKQEAQYRPDKSKSVMRPYLWLWFDIIFHTYFNIGWDGTAVDIFILNSFLLCL